MCDFRRAICAQSILVGKWLAAAINAAKYLEEASRTGNPRWMKSPGRERIESFLSSPKSVDFLEHLKQHRQKIEAITRDFGEAKVPVPLTGAICRLESKRAEIEAFIFAALDLYRLDIAEIYSHRTGLLIPQNRVDREHYWNAVMPGIFEKAKPLSVALERMEPFAPYGNGNSPIGEQAREATLALQVIRTWIADHETDERDIAAA